MSNLGTFAPITAGRPGTAPLIWVASTPDTLATVTTVGYMTDKLPKIKQNDIVHMNFLDASSSTSTYEVFRVVLTSSDAVASLTPFNQVHAATANFAGGSNTAVITDAAITASSVVALSIKTSTTAVSLQKVTPGVGSITVLMSADPGTGTVFNYIAMPGAQ